MKIKSAFMVAGAFLTAVSAYAVDLDQVQKLLNTTGAEGWIHGSVESQGLFVFTYRNPSDFFDYVQMSMISEDPAMMKRFASFDRHDKVLVKGDFLKKNPSPEKHIVVSSIDLIKKFDQPYPASPYQHEAKIPTDLLGKTSGTFLVHALGGNGQILVVEYKDSIVPIFVKNGDLAKNLYRGDVVQLEYSVRDYPDQPTHLSLSEDSQQPIKVIQKVSDLHGKPGTIEGALILFPKSPEISFNVFAVKQDLQEGLSRQFTLVNFQDQAVFAKIRAALQAAWDKHPGAYTNGRNKLVSTRIRVKATGTFNEVDPSQANPQILLDSMDSIQIIDN